MGSNPTQCIVFFFFLSFGGRGEGSSTAKKRKPQAGIEPATYRLQSDCSTTKLLRPLWGSQKHHSFTHASERSHKCQCGCRLVVRINGCGPFDPGSNPGTRSFFLEGSARFGFGGFLPACWDRRQHRPNSSVGRALDWRSKGRWFDPDFGHLIFFYFFFFRSLSFFSAKKQANCWRKIKSRSTPMGLEPTRGNPINLAGWRLNHSATVSTCQKETEKPKKRSVRAQRDLNPQPLGLESKALPLRHGLLYS